MSYTKIGRNRYQHTMPSGDPAVLRKVDMQGVIMENATADIPNVLRQAVVDMLQKGEATGFGKQDEVTLTAEDLPRFANLLKIITRAAYVSPRIVPEGAIPQGEDEIAIEDVPTQDRMYCYQWAAVGGVEIERAMTFRAGEGEPGDTLGTTPDGKDLRAAPIGVDGHSG